VTANEQDTPSALAGFVADRIRDMTARKSLAEIAVAAGFRSSKPLTEIAAGRMRLPLDQVEAVANALECSKHELMLLALPQFMDEHVMQLVLATGAAQWRTEIDQLGTWLIAVATNMRIAIDSMDRTMGAAQTLVELVSGDFERVDRLRVELEKQATAMIGFPTGSSSPQV
jgi:hypothetical protein